MADEPLRQLRHIREVLGAYLRWRRHGAPRRLAARRARRARDTSRSGQIGAQDPGPGSSRDNLKLYISGAAAAVVTAAVIVNLLTADSKLTPSVGEPVEVNIQSAALLLAETSRGRGPQRGRLTVQVTVTNVGPRPVTIGEPVLLIGDIEIRQDPRAIRSPGVFSTPLATGSAATVEMQFETTGKATHSLALPARTRLRIAGQTVPVATLDRAAIIGSGRRPRGGQRGAGRPRRKRR